MSFFFLPVNNYHDDNSFLSPLNAANANATDDDTHTNFNTDYESNDILLRFFFSCIKCLINSFSYVFTYFFIYKCIFIFLC